MANGCASDFILQDVLGARAAFVLLPPAALNSESCLQYGLALEHIGTFQGDVEMQRMLNIEGALGKAFSMKLGGYSPTCQL